MFILGVAGILSLNSCGENQKEEEQVVPMQNDTRMEADEHAMHNDTEGGANLDDGAQTANAEFENEATAAVYEHYLHIKSALVNSDAEEAKNGGQMMVGALEEADASEEARTAAQTIAESEGLHVQRDAFFDLSEEVEGLIADNITSGEVYKQYCPMAFEGSGASWLSASEEIRNPYYGDKMLKCGSVRETIQ